MLAQFIIGIIYWKMFNYIIWTEKPLHKKLKCKCSFILKKKKCWHMLVSPNWIPIFFYPLFFILFHEFLSCVMLGQLLTTLLASVLADGRLAL